MPDFRSAVEDVAALREHYRAGLQALPPAAADKIEAKDPRSLTGSVDLDNALKRLHPEEPRWDYALGVRVSGTRDRAIFLEVHPATSAEVKSVIRKKEWIDQWLQSKPGGQSILKLDRTYIWVASGRNLLTKTSQDLKRLATMGILFEARRVKV